MVLTSATLVGGRKVERLGNTYIADKIVAAIEAVPAITVVYPLNFCPVPPSAV